MSNPVAGPNPDPSRRPSEPVWKRGVIPENQNVDLIFAPVLWRERSGGVWLAGCCVLGFAGKTIRTRW